MATNDYDWSSVMTVSKITHEQSAHCESIGLLTNTLPATASLRWFGRSRDVGDHLDRAAYRRLTSR